jgi:hypothetical protein
VDQGGADVGTLGMQEGVGRGRGAVPEGEKKGGWRLGVELTRGAHQSWEKRKDGYLFGMEIDGPLNLDLAGLR